MKPSWCIFLFFIVLNRLLGNPFYSVRIQYVTSWGGGEDTLINFRNPEALDVSPSGRLYIADTGHHQIQLLTPQGYFVGAAGGQGWEPDEFDLPMGLDASNGLDVFVADYNNRRIVRYDKDLNFIAILKKQDTWPEPFDLGYPLDVALSPLNYLYCIDDEKKRILMFDVNGSPLFILGDYDAGEGRLRSPEGLLIRPDRSVWILDSDTRVVIFDEYGNYSRDWTVPGVEQIGCLSGCGRYGLALIDPSKNSLYVVTETGKVLGFFDATRHPLVTFQKPVDIACLNSQIFVLDQEQSKIHVFSIVQNRQN